MFIYKFLGLSKEDAPTPYYYGSLPAKPEPGQTLLYDETGNRYAVVRVVGEGLVGDGPAEQERLAWADINRGDAVPTLFLQKLFAAPEIKPRGRPFDCQEVKAYSQQTRETRLSARASS